MHVITFYSFKGGVGRTMALVNVAAELVKWGRKVLVVDFDLEAPGLETYKHLSPPEPHLGVVEYVTKFDQSMQVPDIHDYIFEAPTIGEKGGHLWVMPAGRRDPAYRRALVNLNWKRLYHEHDGFLFFEETKKAWEEEFKPDYVLIDSRTGDTDVLGICTRQLPDAVVLLFALNKQNMEGLKNVCNDIRREETEGLKKKIRLHFVAANVPNLDDESGILRRQLRSFRKRLEFKDLSGVIRRYESLELLDQSVMVLDRPRSRLAKSYRRLAETLMKENSAADRDGALEFLEDEIQKSLPRIDYDPDAAKALRLNIEDRPSFDSVRNALGHANRSSKIKDPLNLIAGGDQFLNDSEVLNKVAECWILRGEFLSAVRVLNRSLNVNPNHAGALHWRGQCKRNLNQPDEAAEDFLRSIRVPEKKPLDLVRALSALRDIAPKRLIETADFLSSQEIDSATSSRIAEILSSTAEGVPVAAKFVLDQLTSLPDSDPLDYYDVLGVVVAYWAQTGTMLKDICEIVLQQEEEFGATPEYGIWFLWGAGHVDAALEWLDAAEEQKRKPPPLVITALPRGEKFWGEVSPWSLKEVDSAEQYLDDCEKVRRLFQGEPLRPAFLGPSNN